MTNTKSKGSKLLERDDEGYIYDSGKLFTGIENWYYDTGEVGTVTQYKDGIPDGWMRGYYKSGALKSEAFYEKGCVIGRYKKWYENGTLQLDAEVGKWKKEWDADGRPINDSTDTISFD